MPTSGASRWAGKWALITGASAGIGEAIALELAAAGAHLVVTSRRTDRLSALASRIASTHHTKVEVVPADLVQPGAAKDLYRFTTEKEISVDLLVNNAGFGAFGYIQEISEDRLLDMVQVNCSAVLQLTRFYVPGMIERRRGDILIVASTAGFQAVPFISAYAATKAFDLIFAEGIAEELRPFGVRVCALCPGSTNTEFQQVAHQPDRAFRFAQTAAEVARAGLEGLARGETCTISGTRNRWMVAAERLAPRRFVTKMAARLMRPEGVEKTS